MELIYYIFYKGFRNFKPQNFIFFFAFQAIIFVLAPISIINAVFPNLKNYEDQVSYITFFIGIGILIFDYIYYFRNSKTTEIIAKYSGKYKLVDEKPTLAFLLFFMLPLAFSMFVFTFLSLKYPPFQ